MKKALILVCLACLLCVFNACSYSITYNTNPIGAQIICAGKSIGFSPITLKYDQLTLEKSPYTEPCEDYWISGAKASFPNFWGEILRRFPSGVTYTIQRPSVEA